MKNKRKPFFLTADWFRPQWVLAPFSSSSPRGLGQGDPQLAPEVLKCSFFMGRKILGLQETQTSRRQAAKKCLVFFFRLAPAAAEIYRLAAGNPEILRNS